ncbi:hypothetical protein IT072_19060 [Leifsonia sp. ZF2019]|uniref:hypothetical protein n=1 Tax=Leifsonia sp. ZF2019 TaxID=2781978 RepID=UPI001CC1449B|nr:hypothetical protein [Leifsonia sp. ZF2019]UAJ79271.1 hypothetical protein IT072_19060 [Leifsonia sp. ZF2019]
MTDRRLVEEHVRSFVHAFVDPTAWLALLVGRNTRAGRQRFRALLRSPLPLVDARTVSVADRDERFAVRLLERLGAPSTCVLVKDGLVEDESTTLGSAMHRAQLSGEGALISCISGRLAYLQTADGRRTILYRQCRSRRAGPPS